MVLQPTFALSDRTLFSPEINGAPRAGMAMGAILEVSIEVVRYLFFRLYSSFFFKYKILFSKESKNSPPGDGFQTKIIKRCKKFFEKKK